MPNKITRWQPNRPKRISTREQRHYLTPEWRARRARILIRDANVCTVCGLVVSGAEANVDHIIPLDDGGGDNDANLQTLCRSCHSRKTIAEQRRKGRL
jgi:5-methylcytosine-specific restriction protein A